MHTRTAAFAAAILLVVSTALADQKTVDHLQGISVTVKTGFAQGSGVLVTRQVGDDTVTFVWTAAHVVDDARRTREVVINGSKKTVVEFEDVYIVQEFTEDGRRIGETKMDCQVIRYSDAGQGEDLALLKVRKKNFTKESATFYLEDKIPTIGTELYHVGSLLGQVGANSLTTGVISQVGRVLKFGANSVIFDQTTATAFPGSSGGGIYLKEDGRYVGMLVRGAGEGFNLCVPARRMRAWAKSANVEWALNPCIPLPTEEEFKKLPVEDTGITFSGEKTTCEHKEYPYLLERVYVPHMETEPK